MGPLDDPLPLCPSAPSRIPRYSLYLLPSPMRARVVPPYPSFTYVMSQIGDQSQESQPGSQPYGNVFVKPTSRPYSKYDDNPFMVRWFVPVDMDPEDETVYREPCAMITSPRTVLHPQ